MATKTNDWIGSSLSQGRYVIESKLGEGGMGIVYRARDTRLESEVVIKVPRLAMLDDPEFATRFAREIRSLVTLAHPGIVKVTDVGEQHGLPFAVMQYLPGGSLEDRRQVDADGHVPALDPRTVRMWLTGIADALDYIHTRGYIHRDVKPGNILFDAHGHAFLGDFGVIKALASAEAEVKVSRSKPAATGAGMVLGTPEYMAPELIMGEAVDGRVDQYALAVTVYEMLCGRRPFEGASSTAVVVMHTTRAPSPLTDFRPTIPGRLSKAVLKALAKSPTDRYATCAEFAANVIAAVEASPADPADVSATNFARSESVKVQCSACGRKVAMAVQTFANLKRTGRSFACPNCQEPISVSAEGTRILDMPPSPGARVQTPAGTQKIATPAGTQKIATPAGTQKIATPAGTQKIATPAGTQKIATHSATQKIATPGAQASPQTGPAGRAAATVKMEALTGAAIEEPGLSAGPQPRTRRSPFLWVAAAAATPVVLALAGFIALRPKGPAEGTVQIRMPALATGADILLDERRYEPQELMNPLTLAEGYHVLAVAQQGFHPFQRSFLVSRGASTSVEVLLTRSPVTVHEMPSPAPPAPTPAVLASIPAAAGPEAKPPDQPQPVAASPVTPPPPPPMPAPEDRREAVVASRVDNVTENKRAELLTRPETIGDADKALEQGEVSLQTLIASPEMYAGRDVTVKGLYLLGPSVGYEPNGTVSMPVTAGNMLVSKSGAIGAAPFPKGPTATLEVERGLADGLVAKRFVQQGGMNAGFGPPGNLGSNGVFTTVAMLTVRTNRSTARYAVNGWAVQLVQTILLLDVDIPRISEQKYRDSFKVYSARQGTGTVLRGDPEEWKKRLGQHFLVSAGKVYKVARTQMQMTRNVMVNQMINNMVGSEVIIQNRKNAAEAEAIRDAMTPRPVK